MREAQNIRDVESLGIDLMGFIFYPPSSRFVSKRPEYLPTRAKRVGVFVDADMEFISERIKSFKLDCIQLHGSESPEFCASFKSAYPALSIIKVFSIKDELSLANTEAYESVTDYFLFDTHCKEKGGSGRAFDHSLLQHYKGRTPFLLSGGLGPENISEIIQFSHPMLAGYDLNSRYETAPALKDVETLKQNLTTLKSH